MLHSSFFKFLLRNDLLQVFLNFLIKCNSSCQGATNLSDTSPLHTLRATGAQLIRHLRKRLSPGYGQSITLSSSIVFFCSVIFIGHICFSRINIQFSFLYTINQVFKKWRKCVSGFEVILNHSQLLSWAQLIRLILANSKHKVWAMRGRLHFFPSVKEFCHKRYF